MNVRMGQIDLDKLINEDAMRAEAKRLLPAALVKVGEEATKAAFAETQKMLKKSLGKMYQPSSSSEKRKAIREGGINFRRSASPAERDKIENALFEEIKGLKEASI